jgi:hypothetical protein
VSRARRARARVFYFDKNQKRKKVRKMNKSMFSKYAADRSRRMFPGELLKFTKGVWEQGLNRAPVPSAKTLVAVMNTLTTGHIKWTDGRPSDAAMGLVADGFQPQDRNDLGDLDPEDWEIGEDGGRQDPWQPTTLLVLVSAEAPHTVFTFSTATVGGQGAIAALCEAHGRATEDAGQYPVVTLAVDSYEHRIKSYGKVKTPVFKIIDSAPAAPFDAIVAGERGGAGFLPKSPSLERSSIAVAIGRTPPSPPPHDICDGPASGGTEGDDPGEDMPF